MVDTGAVAALAPGGVLRASINLGNSVLARRDAATGALHGVSVDLAHALARLVGVAVTLLPFDAAAQSVDAVRTGQADIGFFAVDPVRGAGIVFTAPYVLIEGAYLVRDASALHDNTQVDREGVRVVVSKASAYDLYLSRTLKAAQIVRAPKPTMVMDTFIGEAADAAAGIKPQMNAEVLGRPGLRLLPGRFMVIEQAMGMPAGRGARAESLLRDFIAHAGKSGLVAQALQRHGQDPGMAVG